MDTDGVQEHWPYEDIFPFTLFFIKEQKDQKIFNLLLLVGYIRTVCKHA